MLKLLKSGNNIVVFGTFTLIIKGGKIMKFTADTSIGALLDNAPEKAELLLEVGMHCLGCPAARMETLEEACAVHGVDVEELLEKLNA